MKIFMRDPLYVLSFYVLRKWNKFEKLPFYNEPYFYIDTQVWATLFAGLTKPFTLMDNSKSEIQKKIRGSIKRIKMSSILSFFYLNSSVMCQVIDAVAANIIWRVAVRSCLAILVHKALFTRDILAHNIAIKR